MFAHKHTLPGSLAPGVVLLCLLASSPSIAADKAKAEKSAAQLLPSSTIVYAEVTQPKKLLAALLDHPLRKRVESLPPVAKALDGPGYVIVNAVVKHLEEQIGLPWRGAVGALSAGGIHFAIDGRTKGAVLLVKSRDAKTLVTVRDALFKLVRQDAKTKKKPDPIEDKTYRGIPAYKMNDLLLATAGRWLMVTNNAKLGREVLDRYLGDDSKPLADNSRFQTARKTIAGDPTLWAYLNVAAIRDAGIAAELFSGKTDNPAIELLAGGILDTLGQTPFATGSLYLDDKQARLVLATPHQRGWTSKGRAYYLGPKGEAAAPPLLLPKQTLLSLSTYRDLGGMWNAAPDIFNEQANAGLSKANSDLSNLFAGQDFGEDVLGAMRPEIQIVLARQDFTASDLPTPAIKLPAGAIVFRMKDPAKSGRRMKVAYQSIIGFLNIAGAQNGQPQFELDSETHDGGKIVSATYLLDDEEIAAKTGKINYNFSPSIGLIDGRLIIASTRQLARELVTLIKASGSSAEKQTANTQVRLSARVLSEVLGDNKKQLLAQNMLEKGHTPQQAEAEIGMLLGILGWAKDASLKLSINKQAMRLEVGLRFQETSADGRKD
ncbi:MAG: hypothetical protein IID44_18540 [Planctomycetes bacterium]|nr:hypothetical protein [Planctomycetota bacterium]